MSRKNADGSRADLPDPSPADVLSSPATGDGSLYAQRRHRLDLATPTELAIRVAMAAIEAAGADVRLTRAADKLHDALGLVADFVDGVPARPVELPVDESLPEESDEESDAEIEIYRIRLALGLVREVTPEELAEGDTSETVLAVLKLVEREHVARRLADRRLDDLSSIALTLGMVAGDPPDPGLVREAAVVAAEGSNAYGAILRELTGGHATGPHDAIGIAQRARAAVLDQVDDEAEANDLDVLIRSALEEARKPEHGHTLAELRDARLTAKTLQGRVLELEAELGMWARANVTDEPQEIEPCPATHVDVYVEVVDVAAHGGPPQIDTYVVDEPGEADADAVVLHVRVPRAKPEHPVLDVRGRA